MAPMSRINVYRMLGRRDDEVTLDEVERIVI